MNELLPNGLRLRLLGQTSSSIPWRRWVNSRCFCVYICLAFLHCAQNVKITSLFSKCSHIGKIKLFSTVTNILLHSKKTMSQLKMLLTGIQPSISSADIGQQKIECKLLPITCICIQLLRLTKKFPKTPHPSTGGQDIPSPKCSKSWATIINERWVLNVYLHSRHMLFNAWRSEIQSVRWALDWREGQKK